DLQGARGRSHKFGRGPGPGPEVETAGSGRSLRLLPRGTGPASGAQFLVRFAFNASNYDPRSSNGGSPPTSGRRLRPLGAGAGMPITSRIVGITSTSLAAPLKTPGLTAGGAPTTRRTRHSAFEA